MYSLDINFLKERDAEGQVTSTATLDRTGGATLEAEPANWLPAIGGGAAGLLLVAGVYLYNGLVGRQVAALEGEVAALQGQLEQLQASRQAIEQKRQELNEQQALTTALVDIFDTIVPASALLQDLSDRLPPGVQIESFEQIDPTQAGTPATVRLAGIATSYEAANYLALAVAESAFVEPEATRLETIAEEEYAIPDSAGLPEGIELPLVYGYTLQTSLSQDFSAAGLLAELERKGADGLAARIQALRDRGLATGAVPAADDTAGGEASSETPDE